MRWKILKIEGGNTIDYNEAASKNEQAYITSDLSIKKRVNSLLKNKTWTLVINKLKGQEVIDCKWIYKMKKGEYKYTSLRYKDRLVANGFNQIEGVDYNDLILKWNNLI